MNSTRTHQAKDDRRVLGPNPVILPGQFLSELLWTDTRIWELVDVTPQTIKIRTTHQGEVVKRENRDGNPWPCVFTEAISDPGGKVYTLRCRKADGTYRTGQGGNPLKLATFIDGRPCSFTDYRE